MKFLYLESHYNRRKYLLTSQNLTLRLVQYHSPSQPVPAEDYLEHFNIKGEKKSQQWNFVSYFLKEFKSPTELFM
jgi:hypothetical protein